MKMTNALIRFAALAFILVSCTSVRESGDGVKPVKLDDPRSIDVDGSYVFGRFGGTHTSSLGLYLTNSDTGEDYYIAIPAGNSPSGGVAMFPIRDGSYRITAVFIGDKKRPVNDPIYGEFEVERGKTTYIGDFEGSVKGPTVYIRPTSEFARTRADLIARNARAERLKFIQGY